MRWLFLVLVVLLVSGCIQPATWSGDVYYCDRELLEAVAKAREVFENSQTQKGGFTK